MGIAFIRSPVKMALPKSRAPVKTVKAMGGSKKAVKSMGKGAIAAALAEEQGLKKAVCSKIMNSLAALAATEVKKTGKFVIPGVTRMQTRLKPATKAGKREIFGKEVMVKAKPAKTIVKAYPVAAIKKSIKSAC